MSEGPQTQIGILPKVGQAEKDQAVRSIREIFQEMKAGEESIKTLNDELRNSSQAIYAQRRALMLMRTEYRNEHAALIESMRIMRSVAHLGRTLTNVYNTWQLMQIRLATTTENVQYTEENLLAIRERRLRAEKEFGLQSTFTQRYLKAEDELERKLTDQKRDLKRAQDQNIIGYTLMGLSLLEIIPTIANIHRQYTTLKNILGLAPDVTALETITTAAGVAASAIGGIKTAITGLLALAAVPIVFKIITERIEKIKREGPGPYDITPDPTKPPGPANAYGYDLGKQLSDWAKSTHEQITDIKEKSGGTVVGTIGLQSKEYLEDMAGKFAPDDEGLWYNDPNMQRKIDEQIRGRVYTPPATATREINIENHFSGDIKGVNGIEEAFRLAREAANNLYERENWA